MKECTYGWYPPAPTQDVWNNYRSKTNTYQQECLYKHNKSRFHHSHPGVTTPVPPAHITLQISPSHSYRGTGDSPSHSYRGGTGDSTSRPLISPSHFYRGGTGDPASRPPISPKKIRPSPRKAWSSYVPQTQSMMPQPPSTHRNTVGGDNIQTPQTPQRVQSAHIQRERISAQSRPIHSAGPTRQPMHTPHDRHVITPPKTLIKSASTGNIKQHPDVIVSVRPHVKQRPYTAGVIHRRPGVKLNQRSKTPEPRRLSTQRALTPEPQQRVNTPEDGAEWSEQPDNRVFTPELRPLITPTEQYREDEYIEHDEEMRGPVPSPVPDTASPTHYQDLLKETSTSAYENQLREHGWRMEVHGDPLNLKAPCITKRLSCSAKCEVPTVDKMGPKGHMVNYDTNFYNTIPRRRATFDVHREWISEVLHAKRMELQKRDGGIMYRYKNFSFVY